MKEVQRFYQNGIAMFFILIFLFVNFYEFINAEDFAITDFFTLDITVILLIIITLLTLPYLKTEFTEDGISYQFFPFHFSKQKILWEDINLAYVRKYNPLFEYGGWGLRLFIGKFRKKGIAYSVSGNTGLQLELKNGKKILIGTKKSVELEKLLPF